jgi:hypothetical protein
MTGDLYDFGIISSIELDQNNNVFINMHPPNSAMFLVGSLSIQEFVSKISEPACFRLRDFGYKFLD